MTLHIVIFVKLYLYKHNMMSNALQNFLVSSKKNSSLFCNVNTFDPPLGICRSNYRM